MRKFIDIIVESQSSEDGRIAKIRAIAEAARAELQAYWDDEPYWSIGECHSASKMLQGKLTDAGFSAVLRRGYYKCCEDSYPALVAQYASDGLEDDFDADEWDGRWTHWWVVVSNEFIVDITADQFHPSNPNDYAVVITSRNDPCYS